MTPADRRAALEVAEDAARTAGVLLLSHFGRVRAASATRKGRRNLLTVADTESEAVIREELARAFPDDAILGEEEGGERLEEGRLWIVDPLDGTTNFAHELPMWAVSIALVEDGRVEVGVVLAPRTQECFVAVRGEGAKLDGVEIRVSPTEELTDALLATGFAYDRNSLPANNTANTTDMIMNARDVRRMGAAACDLAYVACGRLDGFWEFYLSPWDVAAGALIVEEAGGLVTDLQGRSGWLFGDTIVAANASLHARMRERLRFE